MIYRFVDIQKADFPLSVLCKVCKIPRSSYYDWVKRRPLVDERISEDIKLKQLILEAHEASFGIYGAPRIFRVLRCQGVHVSKKKVAGLMVELGISGACGRHKICTTVRDRHARKSVDLVERIFSASKPDELWVSDLTYIPTGQGWLYLVAITDVFSRRILGWSMADHMGTEIFLDALKMVQFTRNQTRFVGTILHSDHGCQYTSNDFRDQLRVMKITQSMGTVGDSFDNAMAESLWASLKKELVYRTRFETKIQARTEIFRWLNWYNTKRLHSSIGYLSPTQYEIQQINEAA